MKSPQTENGFLRIATGNTENDIVAALAGSQLSGTEYAIVLTILRKTYGFGKKSDWISLSQFVEITGRSRQAVLGAIGSLESCGIITADRSDRQKTVYCFNKTFHEWSIGNKTVLGNKNVPVQFSGKARQQNRTTLGNKTVPTKETSTKETITKEIPSGALPPSPLSFMDDFVVPADAGSGSPPKKKSFNWQDYAELTRLMKKTLGLTTLENGKTPKDNYARHILLKLVKILREHDWPEEAAIDNVRANMESFCATVQRAREADAFLMKRLVTLKEIYFKLPEIIEITKPKVGPKKSSHLSL